MECLFSFALVERSYANAFVRIWLATSHYLQIMKMTGMHFVKQGECE